MQISFRLTEDDDGAVKVEVKTEEGGLSDNWSHLCTEGDWVQAVNACADEVLYQHDQQED